MSRGLQLLSRIAVACLLALSVNHHATAEEMVPLAASECVAYAIEHAPGLRAARYAPAIAKEELRDAWSVYDPMLFSSLGYVRAENAEREIALLSSAEVVASRSDIEQHGHEKETGIRGRLPYGVEYEAAWGLERSRNMFGQNDGTLRRYSLRQSLLRGGWGVDLIPMQRARLLCQSSDAALRLEIIRTAHAVINEYWGLVAAMESLRIEEAGLATAERLLKDNETRLRIGAGSGKEVDESRANVTSRRASLIGARTAVAKRQDSLKEVMGLMPDDPWGKGQIAPSEKPEIDEYPIDEASSVSMALKMRPELKAGDLEIANRLLAEREARNARLPSLDLVLRREEGERDGERFSASSRSHYDAEQSRYQVALEGSIPLLNLEARSARQRARLERERAQTLRAKTEQAVRWDVRDAIRDVNQYRAQAAEYEESVRLARLNVEAEIKLLNAGGNASNYDVLQKQQELTRTEVQAIQARINYRMALVRLWMAEGVLLERLGFEPTGESRDGA